MEAGNAGVNANLESMNKTLTMRLSKANEVLLEGPCDDLYVRAQYV